jgi:DNA-binding LytR/AlgR family response regulator
MKLLLVEDNQKKLEKIRSFLISEYPNVTIEERTSYNSASKEIILNYKNYDLILLDMSMQTYDISVEESGGDPEPLAGKNILNQMYLREIPTKVLVVTMYENFVDGTRITKLDEILRFEYPDNYCGFIFFSHINNDWAIKLSQLIKEIYDKYINNG